MKSSLAVVGTLLLLGLAVGANSAKQLYGPGMNSGAPVEAHVLTSSNWNDNIEDGKEADAIYGDLVLKNGVLTVVIAQPLATRHANMTVRDVAGAIIDLTSSDAGDDQLAAFYPGKKRFAYRAASFRDASGNETTPTGKGISGKRVSVVVKAEQTATLPEVRVVYTLSEGDAFVSVQSNFHNRGSTELTVPLEDDFRADGGKEEMVRSPNATSDRFWLSDRHWGQAYGLSAVGRQMLMNSDARTTAIKYEAGPTETSITLKPGASFQLTRTLYSAESVFHVAEQSRRLLMQGYRPEQLAYGTGGPRDPDAFYSEALLRDAFSDFEILELSAYDAELDEGSAHAGPSAVIDLVARRSA